MVVARRRFGRLAPVGPQRSGGRREPSFLAREEAWHTPGKKVGEAVAGHRSTDARPPIKRGRMARLRAVTLQENDADRPDARLGALPGGRNPPATNTAILAHDMRA
jgi:hypothetical protein